MNIYVPYDIRSAINTFEIKNSQSVTLSTASTRKQFRSSRLNASFALAQKFFPCIAHIINAFLLTNFKNFSRHQKKHFSTHIIARVKALSYFFKYRSATSSIKRIMRQMVNIRAPNATVPKWNRIVRDMPAARVKKGTFVFLNVQYQVAKVAARIISPSPFMKKHSHRKQNKFAIWNYIQLQVYSIASILLFFYLISLFIFRFRLT